MTQLQVARTQARRRSPDKADMVAIREAFDADALVRVCEMSQDDFTHYARRVELEPHPDGTPRFYYYLDNGADILAVAHLDHVQPDATAHVVDTAAGPLVTSGALDDRLGAYVILELLPRLGVTCDWLLTTDEEIGGSTADEFDTLKHYHWMIEFDRGGSDVVLYQYETEALVDLVEASGADVGVGSYSDIAVLEHLGCAGLNWGVGYQDYHSARSHAWLEDTFRMVGRFLRFHRANAGTYLEHGPVDPDAYWGDDDGPVDPDLYWGDDDEYLDGYGRPW